MRIHTDKLTFQRIQDAMAEAKRKGRIAKHVTFETLKAHNSRDYDRSFEVRLEAYTKVDGDGRRYANSGSYGAATAYTATYDEWGWFLAELYEIDPYMRVGSKSYPIYSSDDDFHERTGLSYHPQSLREAIADGDGDPYPFVVNRTGGQAGRKGAGRSDGDRIPPNYYRDAINNPGKWNGWARYAPRTLADVPA